MRLEEGLREMVKAGRLTASMIPDDFEWLTDALGMRTEPVEENAEPGHSYTVILLYPDTIRNSDVETYCVDIKNAAHPRDAVEQAQHQCLADNGWPTLEEDADEGYDPVDFVPLYIFNGIAPDQTFGHFGMTYGLDDVPDRACSICGRGVYSEEEQTKCCSKRRQAQEAA